MGLPDVASDHNATQIESEHVADDLCHLAIQRLFAIGLALDEALARQPAFSDTVQPLIEKTDATIRELRSILFERHSAQHDADLARPA